MLRREDQGSSSNLTWVGALRQVSAVLFRVLPRHRRHNRHHRTATTGRRSTPTVGRGLSHAESMPRTGNGGDKFDRGLAHWMDEVQLPRVQRDSRSKGGATAILAIAQDGKPARGQLDTDLVFATGPQLDFEQDRRVQFAERTVRKPGLDRAGLMRVTDQHFAQPLVFAQPVHEIRSRRFRWLRNQCPIQFAHLAIPKLFGETTGGLGGSSQYDNAGDTSVQPADDSQVDVARFLEFLLEVLSREREQAWPTRIHTHGRQIGRFHHGQQMIILEEYVKRWIGHSASRRMWKNGPLILASQSPRRRQLLEEAGYEFVVMVPSAQAECGVCGGETPAELVARLAYRKAADVARRVERGTIVGCDTVAECLGQVLGKPRDEQHARQMLQLLRGRAHRVLSGLCVWSRPADQVRVEVEVTRLRMADISDAAVDAYLATDAWEGKAGAFGYQDGVPWIEVLEGSESNVVGLPLELLGRLLELRT
jgi:septum formation protein